MKRALKFIASLFLAPAVLYAVTPAEMIDLRARALLAEIKKIPSIEAKLEFQVGSELAIGVQLVNPSNCVDANYILWLQPDHTTIFGTWLYFSKDRKNSDDAVKYARKLQAEGNLDALASLLALAQLTVSSLPQRKWTAEETGPVLEKIREIRGICANPPERDSFIQKYYPPKSGPQERPMQPRRSDLILPGANRSISASG